MRRTRIGKLCKQTGLALLGTAALAVAGAAQADSCREWTQEHWALKAEVVKLYLSPASQEALDAAVFELLQREAYMTSCDARARVGRAHQVGWRMLDRSADEYAAVVVEALLADAGLDLALADLFQGRQLYASPAPLAARGSSPGS